MPADVKISRLYHLVPIGIGTYYIESLTSYIKRLAEVHCVSLGILLSKEIFPCVDSHVQVAHFIDGNKKIITLSSELTKSIVEIIQNKTFNHNIEQLMMFPWNDYLFPRYLFRNFQAWCPACFEESKRLNMPVYEQFIWSFNDVKICNKHHVSLSTECPHCRSKIKLFRSSSRVGYCDNCGSWLGRDAVHSNIKKFDEYIYDSIGSLLSTSEAISENNKWFSKNIENIIINHQLSIREMARILILPHSRIRNWIAGTKPLLIHAIYVSCVFGYQLIDLLSKDIRNINGVKSPNVDVILNKIDCHPTIDENYIKGKIEEALYTVNPPSISAFAKHVGINRTTLKAHFPIEYKELGENYNEYLENRKQEKHDLIRVTMHTLHNQGNYPGRKAINRVIGRNVIADSKDKEVWLSTLRELGYAPDIDN